jgi:hypothetical protein
MVRVQFCQRCGGLKGITSEVLAQSPKCPCGGTLVWVRYQLAARRGS